MTELRSQASEPSAGLDSQLTARELSGRRAVVTGSTSGIGLAIATELARRGADIVLHGRAESSRLAAAVTAIEACGRDATFVLADFSAPTNWDQLVDQAWSCGNVDFWINNAGGDVLTGAWANRSLGEKLDFLWRVDVTASLMLSRAAGRRMQGDNHATEQVAGPTKAIINIGWDQAWTGMAGDSGELFATTKGAIMSMSKSLAQSLAPDVRVNCIAPGWIKTEWGDQASDYWDQRARRESLMDRWGRPEDIAAAAAFLCSPGASFISGQNIPVNGGFRFHT